MLTVKRTKNFWLFSPTQLFTLYDYKNISVINNHRQQYKHHYVYIPRTVMIHSVNTVLTCAERGNYGKGFLYHKL